MATVVNNHDQLLALAAKATQEKATYWDRHTPENSPEPETRELPKDTHNDNEKQERLTNLINHIQNEGDNPYNILEVKSSDDFASRTPSLLKVLEDAEAKKLDGAESALKKARHAEEILRVFFEQCQKEVDRILDDKDSSYQVVLQLDKDGELEDDGTAVARADERYGQLSTFVNPRVFKGKGVDEALKVLDKALEDAKTEDVSMEDDNPQPDAETISLYEKATPIVVSYFQNHKLDAKHLYSDLEEINQEIIAHNRANLGEEGAKMLEIKLHLVGSIVSQAQPKFKLLEKNPNDKEAVAELKEIRSEFLQSVQEYHYPKSWVFSIPAGPGGSRLQQMLDRVPVSTAMDLECAPGATFDGGQILRYNQFFVKWVKNADGQNTDKIESAKYNFLVEEEGRFYIKTAKDIGTAAASAYVAEENRNKFKIGTYYGEARHQIKYTTSFFKELKELGKKNGQQYLHFLGAARKSFETKSRRTMPSEHCILMFTHPETGAQWYDVFARSKLVQLYGDDIIHRIDNYWKELGQEPSRRSPDEKGTDKSDAAAATNAAIGAIQETVQQLNNKVKSLESTQGRLSKLEMLMEKLATNMDTMTESVKRIEGKTQGT